MITKLEITNVQSHEQTTLTFDQGVNIIVGNSDSGKTAIIRALRWLIWNRPSGDTIRSSWGGPTSVRLCTEEGEIIRSRNTVDSYTINIPGKKKMVLKAFGTSVPEEVQRFLNISEINIQRQLDQPFLFSESSGAVAAHFNKVAKLNKIDTSLQNINAEIRQLTSNIKYGEEQEKELQDQLKTFDHLEEMEAEIEVLEEMNEELLNALKSRTKLRFMIAQIKETKSSLKEYEPLHLLETPVTSLLGMYEEIRKQKSLRISLNSVLSSINKVNTLFEDTKADLLRLSTELNKIKICPFCGSKLK